jgi:hypothetical protein
MGQRDSTPDEIRLLYEVTVADLTYFKTQQWAVTNYGLLLLAAIVGAAQFLKPAPNQWERIVLGVLALLVASAASTVLWKLQRSVRVRQARLNAARSCFGREFKAAWLAESKGPEYVHSVYFLQGAVWIAWALCAWLVILRL